MLTLSSQLSDAVGEAGDGIISHDTVTSAGTPESTGSSKSTSIVTMLE